MAPNSQNQNSSRESTVYKERPVANHLKLDIPLNAFKMAAGSLQNQPDDQMFVGRKNFLTEFVSILQSSRWDTGSYLISGYRGAGKTKAVERALDMYAKGEPGKIKNLVLENWCKVLIIIISFIGSGILFAKSEEYLVLCIGFIVWGFLHWGTLVENNGRRNVERDKIFFEAQAKSKVEKISENKKEKYLNFLAKNSQLKFLWYKYRPRFKWAFWVFLPGFCFGIFLPFNWLGFTSYVFLLIACYGQHLWLHYGVDLSQYLHKVKSLIRPVVLVKINLSFQPLDTRHVLFNIVSLLRNELRKFIKHECRLFLYWFGLIAFVSIFSFLHFNAFENIHAGLADSISEIFIDDDYPKKKFEVKEKKTFEQRSNHIPGENSSSFEKVGREILEKRSPGSFLFKVRSIANEALSRLDHYGNSKGYKPDLMGSPLYPYGSNGKGYKVQEDNSPIKVSDAEKYIPFMRWVKYIFKQAVFIFSWSLNSHMSFYYFAVYLFSIAGAHIVATRFIDTEHKVFRRLEKLYERMVFSQKFDGKIGLGSYLKWSREELPIDERQLENELLVILEDFRKAVATFPFVRPDIIFIFDEMDKIALEHMSETHEKPGDISQEILARKKEVDALLGSLKNLITFGQARFIFIAGREMLDSWHADQDSSSLLYESLFSKVFEIPTLLTDKSDGLVSSRMDSMVEIFVCRRLMDKETARYIYQEEFIKKDKHLEREYLANDPDLMYRPFQLKVYYKYLLKTGYEIDDPKNDPEHRDRDARYIILTLREFILYLTYHTWGNLKRMDTVFQEFVRPVTPDVLKERLFLPAVRTTTEFMLSIGFVRHQRILLATNIYIPLEHHMGRRLAVSDDKLKVTTLNALNYILKFHKRGFSRRYLDRMIDAITLHSSPHLNDIIFTLLEIVLKPFVRSIRNGFLRYRFVSGIEREIIYISRVSDLESASYNFSVEAVDKVKNHYKSMLKEGSYLTQSQKENFVSDENDSFELDSSEILRGILGNFYFFEERFDQAAEYFRKTLLLVEKKVTTPSETSDIGDLNVFLFTSLKMANLYERRQNYYSAMFHYERACQIVNLWIEFDQTNKYPSRLLNQIISGDSKWNIFLQPFICKSYLSLKHGPGKAEVQIEFPGSGEGSLNKTLEKRPAYWVRKGRLSFFLSRHSRAIAEFSKACRSASPDSNDSDYESDAFSKATSYSGMADCLFIARMNDSVQGEDDLKKQCEKFFSDYLEFIDCDYLKDANNLDLKKLKDLIDIDLRIKEVEEDVVPDGENSFSINNLGEKKFVHILALLLRSAEIFEKFGLHNNEARVFFKILSYWSTVLGFLPRKGIGFYINAVEEKKYWATTLGLIPRKKYDWASKKEPLVSENKFHLQEIWLAPIRKQAFESLSRLNQSAYSLSVLQYLEQDLCEPIPPEKDDWVRDPWEALKHGGRQDIAFWVRSLLGQNILTTCIWEYNFRNTVLKAMGHQCSDRIQINNLYMPPFSSQNRVVALWLDANYLSAELRDEMSMIFKEQMSLIGPIYTPEFWRNASKAIRNYYWAIQTAQLISGNSQGLMYISKHVVYYNLWEIFHDLIEFCNARGIKGFRKAEQFIQNQIRPHLGDGIPIRFTDYVFVKNRALELLTEIELSGDPTNKARRNILKLKYYIDDDFEDPQFLMEWTMNQAFVSSAKIHRQVILENDLSKN